MGNIGIYLSCVDIEQRRFHPYRKSIQFGNPPILFDNNFEYLAAFSDCQFGLGFPPSLPDQLFHLF